MRDKDETVIRLSLPQWAVLMQEKNADVTHDPMVCGIDYYSDCFECQKRLANDTEYLLRSKLAYEALRTPRAEERKRPK